MKRSSINLMLVVFFSSIFLSLNQVFACSRVVYQGPSGMILTGRTMDWKTEIPANLWVFPRGIERNGEVGATSIKWKSKYGSVIASSWDIASSDGMNEVGLVGNLLWLAESEYPKFDKGKEKGLSITMWLQYALDNFKTVDEAVSTLSKEEFVVVSTTIPGTDTFTNLHLSLSDSTGDNAIFEYIDQKLVIHHDTSYIIMTNSPIYEEQLAVNSYWEGIPGTIMLPGTNRAADRYVRASFYMNAVPKTDNAKVAIATVFSIIRNISVPLGITTPSVPNIASTRWRTVADQKKLVYYFENILNPNIVWLDFSKLDFKEDAKVKMLDLENNEIYFGESSSDLKESPAFKFVGVE